MIVSRKISQYLFRGFVPFNAEPEVKLRYASSVYIIFIFPVIFAFRTVYASGVPLEDMSSTSLCVEYKAMISGQTITKERFHSLFRSHYLMFRYAPIPYLLFSAGIGGTKYSSFGKNDLIDFKGNSGLSGTAGIYGYSPAAWGFSKLTAGANACMLNSADDSCRYRAALIEPAAGVIFLLGSMFSMSAGIKGHILYGTREESASEKSISFSNNNLIRGFFSATLHNPSGAAFATFSLDISPSVSANWKNGPGETSFSFQIGTIIKPFLRRNKKFIDNFHEYDKMKKQQNKMAEELKKGL